MGQSQMSPWVPGPKHGRGTIHKVRQDATGDLIEEKYVEPSFYIGVLIAVCLCAAGWWGQLGLDGWMRGLVLTPTIIVTIYLAVMAAFGLLDGLIGRFIRSL